MPDEGVVIKAGRSAAGAVNRGINEVASSIEVAGKLAGVFPGYEIMGLAAQFVGSELPGLGPLGP